MSAAGGRLPNFLIIGAPKSGTTSLGRYLRHHPEVFIPKVEEPKYFAYPGHPPAYESPDRAAVVKGACWKLDDYQQLFAPWQDQKMGGEKSAQYLWSPRAAGAIRDLIPDVRLIVILRNPADRAHSHFTHNLRALREPLTEFRAALDAEPERKRQNWSYNYLYRERGRYAEQLDRYYDLFPREQILVLLYDDLVEDAAAVMQAVCRHLGVSETCDLPVGERHNVSVGVPTYGLLHRVLTRESPVKSVLRTVLPPAVQRRVWRSLFDWNLAPLPKFDPALRRQLIQEAADDIRRLERLINRDLSAWLMT